ncbi:hypothetical protein DFH09DRAFT_1177894 [Mycena vulgaris]|nr:hypothetical protein DFH09DRAFT_1177894 [Mycena vulgaris]
MGDYIPPDRQPSCVCYLRTREGYYYLLTIKAPIARIFTSALMAHTVDPAAFENYWENVLNEICTGAVRLRIFIVLFLLAIYLLYHRPASGRRAFLILTSVMGILATTQFSLHVVTISLALRVLEVAVKDGRDLVLVTNTVVTDGLCYLVWGRPRKVFVIVPVLLMLGTLATGHVTSYDEDYSDEPYHFDPRIVFSLNLLTNFVMMGLTGTPAFSTHPGWIWWVTRAQRAVLGPEFMPVYNAAIPIILESGSIYCCGLVFQVVALSVQNSYQVRTSLSVLSTIADARPHIQIPVYLSHGMIGQLVNIVPTLIVVRVGLGHTIPTANTNTTSTSRSQIHISIPRPLRFASGWEDVECAASDTDVRLEDVSRK